MRYAFVLALLAAFILPIQRAAAQFSFTAPAADLTILASPQYPGPYQTVHLSLESTLLDLTSATVTWTVNGKTIDGGNAEHIDIQTGAAGQKVSILAKTEDLNGSATASLTLVPAAVDLLFDSNSYVPPFFEGRALPSTGTLLRAQAIPHAGTIATNDLIFTWRQDGAVVASGRGKSTALLAAPPLFGQSTISVEARSIDGTYAATAQATLPGIDPQVTLYIDHPLYGIEYYNALGTAAHLPESEETFAATPYFTEALSPSDARLTYEWRINGKTVPATSENANEITINANGSSGVANLGLSLTSSVNFYLSADQSWTVSFPGALGGGNIPGTTPQPSTSDVFHAGVAQ